jgi:hypothetical protein
MYGAVKVAIIDNGVTLEELSTSEYMTGCSTDRSTPERGSVDAWYSADQSHGTEMARLVHLIWPRLNLYIVKLDTKLRVHKTIAASAAEVSASKLHLHVETK